MRSSAKVTSVDAIKQFKAALADFTDKARLALMEAKGDVQRTISRLQSEQLGYWQREVRTWTNKVSQAKVDLSRAQMQSGERQPILEKKALDAAMRRLDEAENKIRRIRHWTRELERESLLFRGQLQQLDRSIDVELPQAMAKIDRHLDNLEAYLRVKPAATGPAESTGASSGRASSARDPDESSIEPVRPDEGPADDEPPAEKEAGQ